MLDGGGDEGSRFAAAQDGGGDGPCARQGTTQLSEGGRTAQIHPANFDNLSDPRRPSRTPSSPRRPQSSHTTVATMSDGEVEVESPTGYPILPKEVTDEIGSVKLFNKWSYEDVEIRDISLTYAPPVP